MVTRMFWVVTESVAMQFLGSSGKLQECCCAVARVIWVVARLLVCSRWLLGAEQVRS